MKILVLTTLFVLSVVADPEADPKAQHVTKGYVKYSNGAVVPEDTDSVKVAKADHLAIKKIDDEVEEPKQIVYSHYPALPLKYYLPKKVQTAVTYVQRPAYTTFYHDCKPHLYSTNPFYHLCKPQIYIPGKAQVYSPVQPQVYTHGYPAVHHMGKREAVAESETDAQYYKTYNTFSGYTPYNGQYRFYEYTGYPYSSIYNNFYNRRVFKREAEAEPEAESYGYYGIFSGYAPYTGQYQSYGYTGYPYSIRNNFYNRRVFKREAEAEPEADAQYMSYYNNYRVTPYSSGYQTYGYSGYPYTAGYTYNNFYNRHVFKREAEAEPEADAQYMNYYNNGFYGNYQSGFRYPYTNYVNNPYTYNQFNGYYRY